MLVPVLFELTGIYPLNGDRVPEYFFISGTGGTVTCVETARPNMAPVGIASISEPAVKMCYLLSRIFIKSFVSNQ